MPVDELDEEAQPDIICRLELSSLLESTGYHLKPTSNQYWQYDDRRIMAVIYVHIFLLLILR